MLIVLRHPNVNGDGDLTNKVFLGQCVCLRRLWKLAFSRYSLLTWKIYTAQLLFSSVFSGTKAATHNRHGPEGKLGQLSPFPFPTFQADSLEVFTTALHWRRKRYSGLLLGCVRRLSPTSFILSSYKTCFMTEQWLHFLSLTYLEKLWAN